MRPIKFRAWNGKQMFSSVDVGYFAFSGNISWGFWKNDEEVVLDNTDEQAVLMQFTGLLDKNGKEIYVGDLVITQTDKPFEIKDWNEDDGLYAIASGTIQVEVIGNIYENPELLKTETSMK